MPEHYSKRIGYAPWSLTREAGVQSATVNSDIEVPQYIQPVLATGFVDDKGDWKGTKSSDEQFIGFTKGEAIPASGELLCPDTNNFPSIDMTGFRHLQFAVKGDDSFVAGFTAVAGPDTVSTLNLGQGAAGFNARFLGQSRYVDDTFDNVLADTSEQIYPNWTIFTILDRFTGLTNVQIKVTNQGASAKDIDFAFRRLV